MDISLSEEPLGGGGQHGWLDVLILRGEGVFVFDEEGAEVGNGAMMGEQWVEGEDGMRVVGNGVDECMFCWCCRRSGSW